MTVTRRPFFPLPFAAVAGDWTDYDRYRFDFDYSSVHQQIYPFLPLVVLL